MNIFDRLAESNNTDGFSGVIPQPKPSALTPFADANQIAQAPAPQGNILDQ